MEKWQRQNIRKHLTELLENILCNAIFLAKLQSEEIISNEDVAKLGTKGDRYDQAKYLLDILQTRVRGYIVLLKSLQITQQTGAIDILLNKLPSNFLQNSKIELNGRTILLRNILDEIQIQNMWDSLDVLERLNFVLDKLEKREFKLVSNTIPPRVPYYIPRSLSKRLRLNPNIFTQNCPDVFVIDGIDRPMLTKIARKHKTASSRDQIDEVTVRFIKLENRDHWKYIRDLSAAPVHLLNYNEDENILILEETSGCSKILLHFLERHNPDEDSFISENRFLTQIGNQRQICICDLPGMGKTLLLVSLAQHVARDTNSLPIFIRLQHFIQIMKSGATEETDSLTKYELFKYFSNSTVGARILTLAVETYKLRAEIFFDEFDEIDENNLPYAKAFLRSLANEPNIRIYVTSRPHMRHELEDTLGVISYDILPFDEENQIDFLTEYWFNTNNIAFSSNLSLFAEICLKEFKRNISSGERDLAGIPLQCRLIAEVQSKAALRYSQTSENLSNDVLVDFGKSMFEMYRKFIGIKFITEDNLSQKVDASSLGNLRRHDSKIFDQTLKSYHHYLALHSIFPESAKKMFQKSCINNYQNKQDLMSCGLLEEVYNGNNFSLQFTHKTVAEYLAAEYIASYLTTDFEYTATCRDSGMFFNCFTSPETEWDVFWSYTLRNAFKVHRVNQVNISKRSNLCTFTYSTVLYFLDHQIKVLTTIPVLTRSMTNYLDSTEIYEIFESCGHHNFENIFAFVETICKSNINKYKSVLSEHNLCRLVSVFCEYASRELVDKCISFINTLCSLTLDELFESVNPKPLYHSPIEYSCKRQSYDLLEYFLNASCSTERKLLLHICIENSVDLSPDTIQRTLIPMVTLLLNHSPDLIHELDSACKTSLLVNRSSHHLIKLLIQKGADLDKKCMDGSTVVHKICDWISAEDYHTLSVFLTEDSVTRKIFKTKNLMGNTPLHCALLNIKALKTETVQLILTTNEIYVNETNNKKENLLVCAVKGRQSVDLLKYLIQQGADYRVRHSDMEWNLLHVAADTGNFEIFYYLLTFGIDHNAVDKYGRTPFHLMNEHEVNNSYFIDRIVCM